LLCRVVITRALITDQQLEADGGGFLMMLWLNIYDI